MAGGSKAPSFPSNYVTVAHLQERWLKDRDQKKMEHDDLGGERLVEEENGGSRARMEGANKVPSFPSNYVTLAHLQELWLKERDQKKKKEQEDLGQERKRIDDLAAAEIQRKKEVEELERERKRAEDQAAAEILRKKEEGDRELERKRADNWTVTDVQRRSDCVFKTPEVGTVAGEEERKKNKKKKKGKKKQKGTYGYAEGDIRAEKNGLTQIDDVEPKFCSFSVIGWNEAGPSRGYKEAGLEVNDLDHNVGVEPKVAVSSVNRWVRKEGDGKSEERHGFRAEAGAEMDPAFPVSGGPRKNGKTGDRQAKGKQETRQLGHESKPEDELDLTVVSEPNCGVLPANGGPRKNGKVDDRREKGKQETRHFCHESKPNDELDLAAINGPICEVLPANGPRKNGKMVDRWAKGKQEMRQLGHESKPEDELDPMVVSEPNCGVLPENGGPRKNGKMVYRRVKGKQETRQLGHESKPEDELDPMVVNKPNCRVLPENGGPRKNGKMVYRQAKGKQETRQLGHESKPEDELGLTVISEPNCGVLPENGGPRKNGKMGDGRAKGKRETRQFGNESKPEDGLNPTVVSEPKCGALTVNGGPRRGGGKKEASQGAGAENMVERNVSDRKSDIRLELGTLSLDAGPSKNVKKGSEMPKRSREGRQVSLECRPESSFTGKNERAKVFSVHSGLRIDDNGSRRNGEKEASPEAIAELRIEIYGEENQKAGIEPELKALSLNGGRKKGKKSSWQMKKRTEWKPECHKLDKIAETKQEGGVFSVHGGFSQGTGAEMMVIKNPEIEQTKDEARPKSIELQQADSAQKVKTLSFDSGVRRNGKKEVRRGTKDETIAEIVNNEEKRDDIGPELRTLSLNDGLEKNGVKIYRWAEKNPEAGQTSSEAEVGVSSINGEFRKNGKKRESQGGFKRTKTKNTRTYKESQNSRSRRLSVEDGGMAWVKKEELCGGKV